MNLTTLKAFAQSRGLNQSDLARAAGVTRQRVSQWLSDDSLNATVNIRSDHLSHLADELNVSANELLRTLPMIDDSTESRVEATDLLWDRLYPDLIALAIDAGRGRQVAIARLVQVYGLFATARMLGTVVWKKFPTYKKFLHPTRRKELEHVWELHQHRKMK